MQAGGKGDKFEICQRFIRAVRISGVKKSNGDKREECSGREECGEGERERETVDFALEKNVCAKYTQLIQRGRGMQQFRGSRINKDERRWTDEKKPAKGSR